MSRDYALELEKRTKFIKGMLAESGSTGLVYGNSGGKDSALVGILCKKACDNTVGVIMPCCSSSNYGRDMEDARLVSERFGIETLTVDLTDVRETMMRRLEPGIRLTDSAKNNIAPRLRMTTLYAVAASQGRLVAGTGNRCESYLGYYTKWGDGACDFNPIADLTVSEIYDFMRWLGAPDSIIDKPPSAGLFEGQTDEGEMGVTYAAVEEYLQGRQVREQVAIERMHKAGLHKTASVNYRGDED